MSIPTGVALMDNVLSTTLDVDDGPAQLPSGKRLPMDFSAFTAGTMVRFTQFFQTDAFDDTQFKVTLTWQGSVIAQTNINVLHGSNRGGRFEAIIFVQEVTETPSVLVNTMVTLDFGAGFLHLNRRNTAVTDSSSDVITMTVEPGDDTGGTTNASIRFANTMWEAEQLNLG